MRESEEKKLLHIITYPPREAERKKKEAMHIDQMKKRRKKKICKKAVDIAQERCLSVGRGHN